MDEDNAEQQFLSLFAVREDDIRRYVLTLLPDPGAVDDVMQETAVALWKKFDQYDPARPFLNWAFRFAYLEVLKFRKREGVRARFFSDATVEALAAERAEAQDLLEARRRALGECLEKLPARERELVRLRYSHGHTIVASAKHPDQIFLRVCQSPETVPDREPDAWTLVTDPVRTDEPIERVVLRVDSQATRFEIDALRIGDCLQAVVAPYVTTPADAQEIRGDESRQAPEEP